MYESTTPVLSSSEDSLPEDEIRSTEPGSHATWSHITHPEEPVVEMIDVYKHYGVYKSWKQVLSGITLKVLQGEIYTLIGTQGAGKTTVINIMLGMQNVDTGNVEIFGFNPRHGKAHVYGGQVGYMPENTALHSKLTINETLQYYAKILGLKKDYFQNRMIFLYQFLALPSKDTYIKNLSEGQRRRVSFAVAILHEPKLLILDEPTATVDPLLRHSIWMYLHNITSVHQTTVFVTTHYIEEGRHSHKVGVLRNGQIIAEGDPNKLIDKFAAFNLEEVIHTLIYMQAHRDKPDHEFMSRASAPKPGEMELSQKYLLSSSSTTKKSPSSKLLRFSGTLTQVHSLAQIHSYNFPRYKEILNAIKVRISGLRYPSIRRSRAMMLKNFKIIWRSRVKSCLEICTPALFMLLFCLTIGPFPKNVFIGMVNKEADIMQCQNSPEQYMSCQFIEFIGKTVIRQVVYSDEYTANEAVKQSIVMGAVIIQQQFTKSLKERIERKSKKHVKDGDILVTLDITDLQSTYAVKDALNNAYEFLLESKRSMYGDKVENAASVIKFPEPIYGDDSTIFTHFLAPGVVICITYYMSSSVMALSLIKERLKQRLDRTYVAGAANFEIVLAHTITYIPIILIQVLLMALTLIFILEVPMRGSAFEMANLLVLQGVCGIAYGHVIAYICAVELTAIQIILLTCYISMVCSGILWPNSSVPQFLQGFFNILPQTDASQELRRSLLRGPLYNLGMFRGLFVPLIWTLIFYTISTALNIYK